MSRRVLTYSGRSLSLHWRVSRVSVLKLRPEPTRPRKRTLLVWWFVPVERFGRSGVDDGLVVPSSSFLVRILQIVESVHTVNRQRRFVAESLGSVPIMPRYPDHLQLLAACHQLVQLSLR